MKTFFTIVISMFVCTALFAQTPAKPDKGQVIHICTPSRAGMMEQQPLWVFFLNNKQVYKGSRGLNTINPGDINSVNVLKDSTAIKKYGSAAIHGVVEVYLKDGVKLDTNKLKADTVRLLKN